MEVFSSRRSSSSTLDPNAPLFAPLAYQTVEDFSEERWPLVDSSLCFRDDWSHERFQDLEPDIFRFHPPLEIFFFKYAPVPRRKFKYEFHQVQKRKFKYEFLVDF